MKKHLPGCPKAADPQASSCTCFHLQDVEASVITELLEFARPLSNEQFVSNGLNIILEDLMIERGLSLDEADVLMMKVLKQLVDDTR